MIIKTPLVAVDIIIQMPDNRILLIERKNPPYGWALPGGFVEVGETLEHAAIREAKEEVSLNIEVEYFLGCYSEPNRDPRMHVISFVYVASTTGVPKAADDATNVQAFSLDDLPDVLAFDHKQIIQDYI